MTDFSAKEQQEKDYIINKKGQKESIKRLRLRNRLSICFMATTALTVLFYFIFPNGSLFFYTACFIAIVLKAVEVMLRPKS